MSFRQKQQQQQFSRCALLIFWLPALHLWHRCNTFRWLDGRLIGSTFVVDMEQTPHTYLTPQHNKLFNEWFKSAVLKCKPFTFTCLFFLLLWLYVCGITVVFLFAYPASPLLSGLNVDDLRQRTIKFFGPGTEYDTPLNNPYREKGGMVTSMFGILFAKNKNNNNKNCPLLLLGNIEMGCKNEWELLTCVQIFCALVRPTSSVAHRRTVETWESKGLPEECGRRQRGDR